MCIDKFCAHADNENNWTHNLQKKRPSRFQNQLAENICFLACNVWNMDTVLVGGIYER